MRCPRSPDLGTHPDFDHPGPVTLVCEDMPGHPGACIAFESSTLSLPTVYWADGKWLWERSLVHIIQEQPTLQDLLDENHA